MKAIKLIGTIAITALTALGMTTPSFATVTAYLSSGSTCAGANSASFSPSGAVVKVSLCVTSTTESLCGFDYRLVSATALENGRFNIATRAMAPAYDDPINPGISFPIAINNAGTGDLGALTISGLPVAPAANQLIATLDLAPQATATNGSYGISLDTSFSAALVGPCGAPTSVPLAANFTLNLGAIPGAPTIGMATAGAGSATVSYTPPASNGGLPISTYIATSTPGGFTGATATGPVIVTGLTNGTPYTFTVTATNAMGTGPASAASNTVTPGLPGAPIIGSAIGNDSQATISFTAPTSNGGYAIANYTSTCNPGAILTLGALSPIVVPGLTNGTTYTCSVKANNATGSGPSSGTVLVTPSATSTAGSSTLAYITNYVSDNISVIDTKTNIVGTTVAIDANPLGIAFSPGGNRAYVANFSSNSIVAIDTVTNTVSATVAVGARPYGVAVNPSGTRIYVTNNSGNSVSVIDAATNTVVAVISVGNSPYGIAVNPSGSRAYVANFNSNNISVIDSATNTVVTTIAMVASPTAIAFNPAGTRAFVSNFNNNTLTIIDTASNTVIGSTNVGSFPQSVAVNPTGTRAYVANFAGNYVSVIDIATNATAALVTAGTSPIAVAINSTGTLAYVANYGSNDVSVVDLATNTVVTTLAVGLGPSGVALSPDGARVYVTNRLSNNYSVIDTTTVAVVATVPIRTGPVGIAFNPVGTRVYVADSISNNVSVINTATKSVIATVAVGSVPNSVAVNPTGTRAYVTNMISNNVSVLDTNSNTVVATIAVGTAPRGIAVNPLGSRVYVANQSSQNVSVIDTASNSVVNIIPMGSQVFGIAINPAGTRAYVGNFGSSSVFVIDLATETVIATVAVGLGPWGVAVNPAGTRAYIANINSNTVSVIDTVTNMLVATVGVGAGPAGIGVNPAGTRVYVANTNSNNVSVIDTASNNVVATVAVGNSPLAFGLFIGPATVPGAPVIGMASVGDGQATINFTAPVNDGGAAIQSYTATCNSGGFSATGLMSPLTVTGLTNGTTYTCSVTATNSVGVSLSSATVTVIPQGAPTMPQLVTSALPNAILNQQYTANLLFGGSPAPTSITVTGLPPGLAATHNGSGSVAITGTPTAQGNFTLMISATNVAAPALNTTIALLVASSAAAQHANNVTSISAATNHSCALINGGVQCAGYNGDGELGNSTTTDSVAPVQAIAAGSVVTAIASGFQHNCAVVNGGVQCWGLNASGQLGNNSTAQSSVPVQAIPPGSGVAMVSTRFRHTCAVISGGVQCWGLNGNGQLGNNSTANSLIPVQVIPASSNVTAVATGQFFTCAVVNGGVQCWGGNGNGQLGNNSTTQSLVPVQTIPAGSNVTALSAGNTHACVVIGGGVQCWGLGLNGQLGNGASVTTIVPVQAISGGSNVTSVSAGGTHTCALVNGGVKCWGDNSYGQLGDGSGSNKNTPIQIIPTGSNAAAISAGITHTCAIVNGSVQCWGANNSGQFGNNNATRSLTPIQSIATGSGFTKVAAGLTHTCAVVNAGVQCWGNNASGQLGNNSQVPSFLPVTAIPPASNVTAVTSGSFHTCAVISGGLQCWGYNGNGRLGNNSTVGSLIPIQIFAAGSGVTAVSAPRGSSHTCAVVNGGVQCWGLNSNGQLGNNSTTQSLVPVQAIIAGSNATAVAAGAAHTCAVVSGGVQCWGQNVNGQLGNNSTTQSLVPVQAIPAGSNATAVAAGGGHSCAVVSGGVQCWGVNGLGQVGNNSTTNSLVPVQIIAAGSNVTAVSAGSAHSCALAAGGIQCWGNAGEGEIGNNSTATKLVPVQSISVGSNVADLSSGSYHNCVVINGGIACWGDNSGGQLADPSTPPALLPAPAWIVVTQPTSTLVTSSGSPSNVGATVTFTATVTGNAPTGNINFKSDGVTLSGCGAVALSAGSGQCTTTFVTAGTKVITADFSGDTNNAASSGTLSGGQIVKASYVLSVSKSGVGGGLVTGTGINCGADCSESLMDGTVLTLSAAPNAFSTFAGWSGACSGTGACIVTMSASQAVTASFSSAQPGRAGNLDPTFGIDGRTHTFIGTTFESVRGGALQSDGKVVVAGFCAVGGSQMFCLTRFNVDGSVDTAFGGTGKVMTSIGTGDATGRDALVQPDGKIVVAGSCANGASTDFCAARYLSSGILDTSFNVTGFTIFPINGNNNVQRGVFIQADGKLVLSGRCNSGTNFDFCLARLNTDGSLDATFGGTGKVTSSVITGNSYGHRAVLQADGKIVMTGWCGDVDADFCLVRYLTNGIIDSTFGTGGKVIANIAGVSDVALYAVVQPDQKILAGGACDVAGNTDICLARFNGDGSLDTSFNGSGKVTTAAGIGEDDGYGIAVQANGKILVVGECIVDGNFDMCIVRYSPNGTLDTSFYGNGMATTAFGPGEDYAMRVFVRPDGKILIAGGCNLNGQFGTCAVQYSGDAALPASATVLVTSGNPSITGAPVTFTATVTGSTPTGTVNFKSGGTTIAGCGSVVVVAGTALCTTSFATPGTKVITADYSGDANNAASTGTLSGGQVVNAVTITLAPTTLPNGTINAAYSQTINASGGTATYSFTVNVGSLPPGLALSSGGVLSGTPTTAGSFNFTVTATDATTATGTRAYTLTIPQLSQTVTFAPSSPVIVGVAPITLTASATSGLTAFTFATTSASSICTVTGSTLSINGVGTCALTVSQAGNTNYASASANANVVINAQIVTVTSSAGSNGSISPAGIQSINLGSTATFLVTANAGFAAAVTGSCGGTLTGTAPNYSYVTNPVTANCTVSATFMAMTTVPNAPTIGTAIAGDSQATISFAAPANDGGSAILTFTANCNPGGFFTSGVASPLTVTGLSNGTVYTCSVTATNSMGASVPSMTVSVTPQPVAAFTAVQSRKTHGAAGPFDLQIDHTKPVTGAVTVEPRFSGSGHKIVFQFPGSIGSVGTATVVDSSAAAIGTAFATAVGNEVIVTLIGVPDKQRVTVTVDGINGSGTASVSLGFLVGDVNSTRSVNSSDFSTIRRRIGQTTVLGNFRSDINASGTINQADLTAAKARAGAVLPP